MKTTTVKSKKYLTIAFLLGLLIISVVLALIGPRLVQKRDSFAEDKQAARFSVTARGHVESERDITLYSQIAGTIREMKVGRGDLITKGQTLVLFDDRKITERLKMAESEVREAEARLRELESGYRREDVEMAESRARRAEAVYDRAAKDFGRLERLYPNKAVPYVELEQAEERMKVAGEEVREARANLSKLRTGFRTEEIERARATRDRAASDLLYHRELLRDYRITAPMDGAVIERHKDVFEAVDVGTPVLAIVDTGRLRIRAELEESDVGKVVEGQSVEVTTDAYRGKVYRGKVIMVSPAVKRKTLKPFDPRSSFDLNTQDIHVSLEDSSGLASGMTVTVKFIK